MLDGTAFSLTVVGIVLLCLDSVNPHRAGR